MVVHSGLHYLLHYYYIQGERTFFMCGWTKEKGIVHSNCIIM